MSNDKLSNNDMNETGTTSEGVSPGRYSSAHQWGTGRYQATAKMQWSKQVNIVVMEFYYRSRPVVIIIIINNKRSSRSLR